MPNSPFDNAPRLHGMVGKFDASDNSSGNARPTLLVSASGDQISNATGLAPDLELLVRAFVHRPSGPKLTEPGLPDSAANDDIQFAIYGLNLDPDEEEELRRIIRLRIREHLSNEERRK